MNKLIIPVLAMALLAGCNAQQAAQTASAVIQGVLNVAQAEEAALPAKDAAILTTWVNLGMALDNQLNTCIASTTKSAALVNCINAFVGGLMSPTELAQLRILSPSAQHDVQLAATIIVTAVNVAMDAYNASHLPNPTIGTAPSSAEMRDTVHQIELSTGLSLEGYLHAS